MSVIPCQVPGENWLTGRKLCPRERPHGVIPHQASPRASPLLLSLTLKSHMLPARGSCKSPDHRVWFGKFASDPLVHLIPRFLKWPLKWNSQLAKATLIEVCRTGVGRCWDAIWLASHSSVWIVPRFDAQYNLGCINFHVAKWPSGRNCLSYLNSCPWNYPIWNLLIPADDSQHVLTLKDCKYWLVFWLVILYCLTATPSQLCLTSWSQAQTERLQI